MATEPKNTQPTQTGTEAIELMQLLPPGFEVGFSAGAIAIIAPEICAATRLVRGMSRSLAGVGDRLGTDFVVTAKDSDYRHTITRANSQKPEENPLGVSAERAQLGSYGASRLRYRATPEEVEDFLLDQKFQGRVVTVTSLLDFKPLYMNANQIKDRAASSKGATRWTGSDWQKNGFLPLWRDSFQPGHKNYFQELYELTAPGCAMGEYVDHNVTYRIRRPSGALGEYGTRYIALRNFQGFEDDPVPARIGISLVGDWRIVEAAPDGSEMP